jgi:hypothetical protein
MNIQRSLLFVAGCIVAALPARAQQFGMPYVPTMDSGFTARSRLSLNEIISDLKFSKVDYHLFGFANKATWDNLTLGAPMAIATLTPAAIRKNPDSASRVSNQNFIEYLSPVQLNGNVVMGLTQHGTPKHYTLARFGESGRSKRYFALRANLPAHGYRVEYAFGLEIRALNLYFLAIQTAANPQQFKLWPLYNYPEYRLQKNIPINASEAFSRIQKYMDSKTDDLFAR